MALRLQSLALYYHTIKHLKAVQWYGQLKWRWYQPTVAIKLAPPLRLRPTSLVAFITTSDQPCAPNMLEFMGVAQDMTSATIWHDLRLDKLWRYHLHYFDYLNTQETAPWQKILMLRWINENGQQRGDGWEPYPLSRRIVNWIKWLLTTEDDDDALRQSLATQVRCLSKRLEYHLQANHLFANAKALLFAGAFFSGKEGARWLKKGYALLQQEVYRQILADGGHIERSPMYHAVILHDLMDCINLLRAYHISYPVTWTKHTYNMLLWLQYLTHPDGDIAFFNDSTLGVADRFKALCAYYQRLHPEVNTFSQPTTSCLLPETGFARLQKEDLVVIADVGSIGPDYQPGHAHAETLSFELSYGSQRVFVNSGISTYNVGAERLRQRGTAAHNTLMVDGENSSHVWQSFRVARRAAIVARDCVDSKEGIILQATHDGYWDKKKILHQRAWRLKDKRLEIQDLLLGNGCHRLGRYYHLHPTINVTQLSPDRVMLSWPNATVKIIMEVDGVIEVIPAHYHPGFNCDVMNNKLVIETTQCLPIELNTVITVVANAAA